MEEDSIIEEENGYNSDIDIENTNNQKLINLYKALDTAKIKPYKDSPYVIEVYVQTMEDKNLIDNIKRSLTQDIMKDLGYPTFRIEVIDTSGESNKALPYSPIDKFNYFKKTTPAIELLRESFNADIKH